jgi:hypothetical protein
MSASRQINITNEGQVSFFENETNGNNAVSLKAPASLAADIAIVLPDSLPATTKLLTISSAGEMLALADGTSGYFLQTDGAGNYIWAVGASTLQIAYNGGKTIDASAGAVDITASSTDSAVIIEQEDGYGTALNVIGYAAFEGDTDWTGDVDITGNVTITGDSTATGDSEVDGVVTINNTSTDNALTVNQTGVGYAGIKVVMGATGSASYGIEVTNTAAGSTSYPIYVHTSASNTKLAAFIKTDGGNGGGVYIEDNAVSTGADGTAALYINNSGTSDGHRSLKIAHSHSGDIVVITRSSHALSDGSSAISITDYSTGAHDAISIVTNTTSTLSQIISATNFTAYHDGRLYCHSISNNGSYYFRHILGIVDADGTILEAGSHDWTSSVVSTSVYTVNYTGRFTSGIPIINLTVLSTSTTATNWTAHIHAIDSNSATFHVVNGAGTSIAQPVSFSVFGRHE